MKYVYSTDNKVDVYKTSDNTLVQSYTETETEANEETGVEAKTDITETHFGTSYSSIVKDKSISYTTGSNTIAYSYQTTGSDEDEKVSSDTVKNGNVTALSSAYTYDDNGNVLKKAVTANGSTLDLVNTYDDKDRITSTSYSGKTTNYTYDADSQLTGASGDGYSASYSYDSRGNIANKTVNGTETTFTYANSGWKDQLVSVNGTELTYDANGNVLTYGDKEFSWNTGRNLAGIVDGDNTYSYTYDESGIRTSKTVNGVTTYYNTNDGVILSQSDGTNTMYFQYDTNGIPLGFIYNGVQYLYLTNQMGDVVAVTQADGEILAAYEYDEWGKLLYTNYVDPENASTKTVVDANPLRYRGYYYDTETGYYYLQSRYYDPNICRFINADVAEIANVTKGIPTGTNLFAYCSNNPINDSDPNGQAGIQSILSVLGNAIGTVESILELIANTCKKELNKLKSISRNMAKSNSRRQKRLLQDTIDETEKCAKKLGRIGKIIASVAIAIGIINAIRSGASLLFIVIRFLAELITEAISAGINKICQYLASAIPGVGFIVRIVVSIGASYLLSRYFSDRRINNIAYAIRDYIGSRNRKNVNKKDLLKVALRKAFC